ncbi:unnamed protein product, partial [Closterium sp. NIES-53]
MSKVLIAEGLGYNLLCVSQLMAKEIHLEVNSTTQELKLYNGKGGLYIGKAVVKKNVFVPDFVTDQGTADSDSIVNFTTCRTDKGVSSDSIDNSSRDNSSNINIGSSRDNSSSDTDRSRSNNNSISTNCQLFINTNSHHRHHTDSHSTADSPPTQSSQKHQHHRKVLLQLRSVQTFTWTLCRRITMASK